MKDTWDGRQLKILPHRLSIPPGSFAPKDTATAFLLLGCSCLIRRSPGAFSTFRQRLLRRLFLERIHVSSGITSPTVPSEINVA